MPRFGLLLACGVGLLVIGWIGRGDLKPSTETWKVAYHEGNLTVWQSPGSPIAYLLQTPKTTILIDAPESTRSLPAGIVPQLVLLTHHHRDTVAAAAHFVAHNIPVHAAPESEAWLNPERVQKYWQEAIPLRSSRTAYFVVPVGVRGINFSLTPGHTIPLDDWTLTVIPTPGHSQDHRAFSLTHPERRTGPLIATGDAFMTDALWTPFTTDWDHWTDVGLKPTAESLDMLAKLKPHAVFTSRSGPIVGDNAVSAVLDPLRECVREVARHKSFEAFAKARQRDYPFLVPPEQVASGGDKPWSRVSPSLWLTGNTYVLKSPESNSLFVLDPWGQRSVDQIAKLRAAERLGDVEVIAFSHAHYDHFDGVYLLPGREQAKLWALDRVAAPLAEPFRFRAPFLDARPIRCDRVFADGDTVTWREYTFRFIHLPGQTEFTCGIEATIDGKRCLFTADNFFHIRQFSGSGGWMGLNRSFPGEYAKSARKVAQIAPEWILAEHGGPYVYDARDYALRAMWGDSAELAASRICPSRSMRRDWNPHRVSIEPIRVRARPGDTVTAQLHVEPRQQLTITFEGHSGVPSQRLQDRIQFTVPSHWTPGRYIFAIRPHDSHHAEVTDTFFAVDCE